jgi:hypothetical protein
MTYSSGMMGPPRPVRSIVQILPCSLHVRVHRLHLYAYLYSKYD